MKSSFAGLRFLIMNLFSAQFLNNYFPKTSIVEGGGTWTYKPTALVSRNQKPLHPALLPPQAVPGMPGKKQTCREPEKRKKRREGSVMVLLLYCYLPLFKLTNERVASRPSLQTKNL